MGDERRVPNGWAIYEPPVKQHVLWHFFEDGRSLCGSVEVETVPLEEGARLLDEDTTRHYMIARSDVPYCLECMKKREEWRAAQHAAKGEA